jgi:hypothetical protein
MVKIDAQICFFVTIVAPSPNKSIGLRAGNAAGDKKP